MGRTTNIILNGFVSFAQDEIVVYRHTPLHNQMDKFRFFIEKQAFGVCSRLGEKMNISASSIRLYFIYTSFLTLGSPVVLYLIMAFWLEMNKHLRRHAHPTIWEL